MKPDPKIAVGLAQEAEQLHGLEWERRFERLREFGMLEKKTTPMGHVASMSTIARAILSHFRDKERS